MNIGTKPRTLRSPKWAALAKRFVKGKSCAACGRSECLVVHHIKPFHLHPELELEEGNLIVLCEGKIVNCHLAIGHLFNWRSYNVDVAQDSATVNAKVKGRP